MNIKEEIKKDVFKILKDVDIDSIIIEKPKDKTKGDYAIPCFTFSKVLRKSPIEIANYIKDNLDQKKYEKVEVVNGYLNIFVQKKVIVSILTTNRDPLYHHRQENRVLRIFQSHIYRKKSVP